MPGNFAMQSLGFLPLLLLTSRHQWLLHGPPRVGRQWSFWRTTAPTQALSRSHTGTWPLMWHTGTWPLMWHTQLAKHGCKHMLQ
jgi:hypothetical protein